MAMMDKTRDSGLDALRFLAISSVILLHLTEAVPSMPESIKNVFAFGWVGVDLFFVLSGFLIGQQAIRDQRSNDKKEQLRQFWVKRWFRTLPLYFVVLFVYLVVKPSLFNSPFEPNILPYFFFAQNYFTLTDFVQSWSICIEEQFYLLFPIIVFVVVPKMSRKPIFWLMIAALAVFLRFLIVRRLPVVLSPSELDAHIRFPFYTHFDGLALGVFLAASLHKWKDFSARLKTGSLIVGVSIIISTCWFLGASNQPNIATEYYALLATGFALMTVGAYKKKVPVILLPVVEWIAILSYGAYLWNNLIMRFTATRLHDLHWSLAALAFVGLTFFVALITYYVVERPFMMLRSKIL